MEKRVRIISLHVGRVVPFGSEGGTSGIDKHSVEGAVALTATGFEGDQQADRRYHGGAEKAVHHYPGEHYAAWRDEYPDIASRLFSAGALGENIATLGMTEREVCVGDVYRVGGAALQVSQVRQPCWKIDARFGVPGMARRVQETGRAGWYYRVVEAGLVAAGDPFELEDRPHAKWSVTRVLRALFVDTLNRTELEDRTELEELSELTALSPGQRRLAARRFETGEVESWTDRLTPPR